MKHALLIWLVVASSLLSAQRPQWKAPQVGDVAPLFTLHSLDDSLETCLSSFRGKKPVVLFFGSYT